MYMCNRANSFSLYIIILCALILLMVIPTSIRD